MFGRRTIIFFENLCISKIFSNFAAAKFVNRKFNTIWKEE